MKFSLLTRQLDISELVVAGNHRHGVRIVAFVPVIVAAACVRLCIDDAGSFLYGALRADGANMGGAAMQALHVAQAGEPRQQVAWCGPLDASFFAAVGAIGGGRKQRFWFTHGFAFWVWCEVIRYFIYGLSVAQLRYCAVVPESRIVFVQRAVSVRMNAANASGEVGAALTPCSL